MNGVGENVHRPDERMKPDLQEVQLKAEPARQFLPCRQDIGSVGWQARQSSGR